MTPEKQRALFTGAVAALGGYRSAAKAMGVSERTMGRLLAGSAAMHEGFLRDAAAALLAHADHCRRLERRLSPDFPSNLVDGQPAQDGRRARGAK